MKNLRTFNLFINESEEGTYSFEELSPEAQEHAIGENQEINVNYEGWEDGVTEGFKEDMEEIGISDIDISYTGFYSQGDGASFTSNSIDTRKLFNAAGIKSTDALDMEVENRDDKDKEFHDLLDTLEDIGQLDRTRIKPEDLKVTIERGSSNYSHENTISVNIEIWDEPDGWKEPYDFVTNLEREMNIFVRKKCKELYSALEKDYEFLTSDEAVKETLIDNDYQFDEEGNLV
jgi:hypothetical protein